MYIIALKWSQTKRRKHKWIFKMPSDIFSFLFLKLIFNIYIPKMFLYNWLGCACYRFSYRIKYTSYKNNSFSKWTEQNMSNVFGDSFHSYKNLFRNNLWKIALSCVRDIAIQSRASLGIGHQSNSLGACSANRGFEWRFSIYRSIANRA